MSGGISAIRGFDYQATVILDLLFDHFDRYGPSASVRPEGGDDLDLRWTDAGVDHRRFVQIKKPVEDDQTRPNPSPWTLVDIVPKLLPDAFDRLVGNDREQVWVIGDPVAAPVRSLFNAGVEAPAKATGSYWKVVHRLARSKAKLALPAGSDADKAASRWWGPKSLSSDPEEAQTALSAVANTFGKGHGVAGAAFAERYAQEAARLHADLPDVLGRIQILDANGAEVEVAGRVMQRLEQRYGLQRATVEHTLFRNLRGFINDIAKQPERSFDFDEFETELRCVWPQMVPIKTPPPLEDDHIRRPALTAEFTDQWTGTAVEVVGISGSGKTLLATEIINRSRQLHPDRLALYAEVRGVLACAIAWWALRSIYAATACRDPSRWRSNPTRPTRVCWPPWLGPFPKCPARVCCCWISSRGVNRRVSREISRPSSARCSRAPCASSFSGRSVRSGNSLPWSERSWVCAAWMLPG